MIPKKIHFCWLSGDEFPPLIQYCIDTWKKVLPDYEIILWDTKRFDINSVAWVKEAFEAKKYAFAADYIRLYAVYTEGGIYLDSDVEMVKSFNDLLTNKAFIGFEAATEAVEAAIFGGEPGTEWCRKAMEFYHDKHFSMDEKGGVNLSITAPVIVKDALCKTYLHFPQTLPTKAQLIDDSIMVCPAHYFSPIKYDMEKSYSSENKIANSYRENPETYCIHRFNAAWGIKPSKKLQLWDAFKKKLKATLGEKQAEKIVTIIRKLK